MESVVSYEVKFIKGKQDSLVYWKFDQNYITYDNVHEKRPENLHLKL